MRDARPRSERLRQLGAGSSAAAAQTSVPAEAITKVALAFDSSMGFTVSGSPVTKQGTLQVGLEQGREIPLSNRILHNDGSSLAVRNIVICSGSYPEVEDANTLYILVDEED